MGVEIPLDPANQQTNPLFNQQTMSDQELVQAAIDATQYCYAPYSNFKVGAALLTADGEVITGVNIENAAYSPTNCAERTAVFKAVSEGKRDFVKVAVVSKGAVSPCGVCRQVMTEFAPQIEVVMADLEGNIRHTLRLDQLLVDSFGPENL